MTDSEDGAVVDDDGYPTDGAIQRLREFVGAPSALVDLVVEMWWTPTLTSIEKCLNDWDKVVMRVRLATGGWSGNEQLIAELDRSYFSLRFWEQSCRGGLHVYEVPIEQWGTAGQLGAIYVPTE